MKKITVLQTLLIVVLLILSGWLWSRISGLEKTMTEALEELGEPDLYTVMSQMQTQLHKLNYAIEAEHADLVDFYLHELEEAAEDLIESNLFYGGQPVGLLTESMLEPVIDTMEDLLEGGYWEQLREKQMVLVRACNDCHRATGYGSIIVTEKAGVNPFNQEFRKMR